MLFWFQYTSGVGKSEGSERSLDVAVFAMGITGLLPFLKKASRPAQLGELSGSVAAIDAYCWLHKGAFGCAEKLVRGQDTDSYVVYVMRQIDVLLHHRIKPVVVFDGRNLPSKAQTEKKRRENRAKHRQMAIDYLHQGRTREARECYQRCVDVTPEMARRVITACRERNIDCVVAPYEADAQLAFLCSAGLVDFIISEDSDLTLFGCKKILFKLSYTGHGILYEREKLGPCLGARADSFSFDKFRRMCITSGCDYLASLHGIGLGKAFKFWSLVSDPDIRRALPKMPAYLNMSLLNVTQDYIEGFIRAENTFLYQLVFDLRSRRLRPLNEYPDGEDLGDLSYAGTPMDDQMAMQMCLGNLHLHTLEKLDDFDPDNSPLAVDKPLYGTRTNHVSIWSPYYDAKKPFGEMRESRSAGSSATQTVFGDFKRCIKRKMPGTSEVGDADDGNKIDWIYSAEKDSVNRTFPGESDQSTHAPGLPTSTDLSRAKNYSTQYSSHDTTLTSNLTPLRKTIVLSRFFSSERDPTLNSPFHGLHKESSQPKSSLSKNVLQDMKKAESPSNSGSWLDALDKIPNISGKLIYDTDRLNRSDIHKSDREQMIPASKMTDVHELLLSDNLKVTAMIASRQAFKPMMSNSDEKQNQGVDKLEKCLERNLSAKTVITSDEKKSPEEADKGDPPLSLPQLPSVFQFESVPSSQESSQENFQPTSILEKQIEIEDEEVSSYFGNKSMSTVCKPTRPLTTPRSRGVSGLLKKKTPLSMGKAQRSLLEMWAK